MKGREELNGSNGVNDVNGEEIVHGMHGFDESEWSFSSDDET